MKNLKWANGLKCLMVEIQQRKHRTNSSTKASITYVNLNIVTIKIPICFLC